MASSFSTDLKLELMVTGENAGTWGTKTNTNLNLLQQAIAGFQSISIGGGAQTTALTMDNAAISNARNAVIKLTGTITGNQIVTIPTGIEKTYIVSNGTTGTFTVEFKQAGGTGTTFSTTDKGIKILFADGTNITDVNSQLKTISLFTLPATDGAANQFIKTNGSGVLSFAVPSLSWQSVKTSNFTAVKGEAYPINTTSSAITVTLPATPSAGDQVQVVDYAGTFDSNALTINPNGEDIEGGPTNLLLTGEREGVILTYIDSTQGWIATSGINEGTNALEPSTFSADFLVVAGGGGGGNDRAGGGGAGGLLTNTATVAVRTSYTITVGGGGGQNVNGNNSLFGAFANGSTGAVGGGKGGNLPTNGSAGGSGGGAGANTVTLTFGGAGTAGQGNAGGDGQNIPESPRTSGGGGGAGAAGAAGTGVPNGGAGTASSITGSSVTRAGGGGGGSATIDRGGNGAGAGGAGGGGNGGAATGSVNGTAGAVNTGGGGGGAGGQNNGAGGAGGSGIVILKYPDTLTISNPGGGLTSSTSTAGGFSVTSFTAGTGNIQFN